MASFLSTRAQNKQSRFIGSVLFWQRRRDEKPLTFLKKYFNFFYNIFVASNRPSSNCTTPFSRAETPAVLSEIRPRPRVRHRYDKYAHIYKEEKTSKISLFRCFFVIFLSEILIIFCQSLGRGRKCKNRGTKVCLVLKQEIFAKPLKNLRHFDIIHGE